MLRVKQERERLGLSQSKLARIAEVNATSMSRIERGKEPPYPLRAERIAKALGWTGDAAELFKEVDDGGANEASAKEPMASWAKVEQVDEIIEAAKKDSISTLTKMFEDLRAYLVNDLESQEKD